MFRTQTGIEVTIGITPPCDILYGNDTEQLICSFLSRDSKTFVKMLIEEITQYLKQLLETVISLQGAVTNIETHAAISNSNLKAEEEVQLSKEHFTHLADVITDKTTKCENNM